MENEAPKFFSKKSQLIILSLTFVWFAFFAYVLRPFVPSTQPLIVYTIAAFTACALTGVFFIAAHMFTLVLTEQRANNRK
jgi:hypothetical protein